MNKVGKIFCSLMIMLMMGGFSCSMGIVVYSCPWNSVGEILIGLLAALAGGIGLLCVYDELMFMVTGKQVL